MSRLAEVPGLAELVKRHHLEAFVETGCGDGEGLRYATELGLERRLSCDLNHAAVVLCQPFGVVAEATSTRFLEAMIHTVAVPTLFWLDAHFPEKFGATGDKWPLRDELAILARKRGIERDVILCDDMHAIQDPANPTREDGPGHDWEPVEGTIAELVAPFLATHQATLHTVGTGILVLEPR
jgi:hypothetical protein